MEKRVFDQVWDQTRQKYGIYLRLLEAMPEACYFSFPIPAMRTPAELMVHVSATIIRDIAQGVAKGNITADEASEGRIAKELGKKAALIAFARECWELADAAVARIGPAELSATVPTPWGKSFPGWVAFNIQGDEFLHHRGQLYAYARACGVAPPSIYSFAENAPEFRPSH
ncbi:MAG TPA: DinB family protein [Gemmatimonadales bacterium]|nr:DinB family protein [Gemmatimonadales bacterium]